MSNEQIASFLNAFSEEIESDNAAIFAGAGLSRAAGFVDWKMLLKSVAASLGLDVEKESNLIALAQYYPESGGWSVNLAVGLGRSSRFAGGIRRAMRSGAVRADAPLGT